MNRNLERKRDFIGSILFVCFVLVLVVGGFFATKYLTSDSQKKQIRKDEQNKYKVNAKKDFVYFDNEVTLCDDPDIVHKDIVINLTSADTLNKILKEENDVIRSSVKKISESELDPSKEVLYKEGDVFYTKERNYSSFESSKYLSILITDGEFNCYTGSQITSVKSYNFNLANGKQLSNQTILGFYSMSIDDVKGKVSEKLAADQVEFGENTTINVEETINSITVDNAALYYNNTGKLNISIIVKTSQESYNDTIELN